MDIVIDVGAAVILLVCAAAAFAAAGAAAALQRYHVMDAGRNERGLTLIAGLLAVIGALCAGVVTGTSAVAALAVPVAWASYVFTAQRLGLFTIMRHDEVVNCREETELHT